MDAYDALTSDRNFRKRYLPHEAIEYLMGSGDTHFSFELVKNFCAQVAPYPPGTMVKLTTGDTAVVLKVDMAMSSRPLLRMVYDPAGKNYPQGEELDLQRYSTVTIAKVLDVESERPVIDNMSTAF